MPGRFALSTLSAVSLPIVRAISSNLQLCPQMTCGYDEGQRTCPEGKSTRIRGLSELQRTAAKRGERRFWRREWDSNPRYGFPYTRFPSVRLKPLGHPSASLRLD